MIHFQSEQQRFQMMQYHGGNPGWPWDNKFVFVKLDQGFERYNRPSGIYNTEDDYFIFWRYADQDEGYPAPLFGIYEDESYRLVYEYWWPAREKYVLGRVNLSTRVIPPVSGRQDYLEHFEKNPKADAPASNQYLAVVRGRIAAGIIYRNWPYLSTRPTIAQQS